MIVLLHGRELKVGDTLDSTNRPRVKVTVIELAERHLRLVVNLSFRLSVPWDKVKDNFSWPEREPENVTPSSHQFKTREDLVRHYNEVIAPMCEGTTVKPWKCVRLDGAVFAIGHPSFNALQPGRYGFALAVHLNRPVWVGSVLYGKDAGRVHQVTRLTQHGREDMLHTSVAGGVEGDRDWRDWAVWDKPVEHKKPHRVSLRKEGYRGQVTVPEWCAVAGRSVKLEFATHKDADEFYERFNALASDKKD